MRAGDSLQQFASQIRALDETEFLDAWREATDLGDAEAERVCHHEALRRNRAVQDRDWLRGWTPSAAELARPN